jgi:hypothetical protein
MLKSALFRTLPFVGVSKLFSEAREQRLTVLVSFEIGMWIGLDIDNSLTELVHVLHRQTARDYGKAEGSCV